MHLDTLVSDWLSGFCVSRRAARRTDGPVVEVDVRQSSRRLEYFLVEPAAALFAGVVGRVAGQDDVWLTAFTATRPGFAPPAGVRLRDADETLMTTSLGRPAPVPAPVPDTVEIDDEGDRAIVRIRAGDEVAAEGQVAVVGGWATFDRIRTHEGHQRRGHGTVVMGALTAWAMDGGARSGVLAASVDGQALYRRLGWHHAAMLTTWCGAR